MRALRLMHKRLGHISEDRIEEIMRNDLINLPNEHIDTFYRSHHCDTCLENKATRRSFEGTMARATKPGETFYMDVQGPFQTQSLEGHNYIVGFIDSFSRRCFTYYTDRRNKVPDIFINQFYPNILKPCIDNNLSGGHAKVISIVENLNVSEWKYFVTVIRPSNIIPVHILRSTMPLSKEYSEPWTICATRC